MKKFDAVYNEKFESIPIREIQDFIFCKRQFGLIKCESQWLDNYRVIEGNIVHTLVDDPFFNEKRKTKHISRSVPVYSDSYGIHGVADLMEFVPNKNGGFIKGKEGKFSISIIEYKNGSSVKDGEIKHADKIQLRAQMLCAEEMFSTKVNGFVYYAGVKKRFQLLDEDNLIGEIVTALAEIREIIRLGITPPVPEKQNCNECSLKEICLPSALKRHKSVYHQVNEFGGD